MELGAAQKILKDRFGYADFRSGQRQVLTQLFAGNNVLALMPTGGGKSLCYQIPALLFDGLTVVVSPLISLMKDQVDALNANDIPATYINSTLSYPDMRERLNEAAAGEVKLLYLAPERLESESFMADFAELNISLLAVDEAHCISQWGHDFRPSYLALSDVINQLASHPQIIALTATATKRVARDICERLNIASDAIVRTSFARDNLALRVVKGQDTDHFIQDYLKMNPTANGIIYASTRKEVERLTKMLQKHHFKAAMYHAGLSEEVRRTSQEDFLFDRVQVLVATNAFGMGIDKSNVRFVIHAQVPGSLEAYYQEAGRAGRDGLPSDAILIYRPQDTQIQRFFIDQSELPDDLKRREYQKVQLMSQYANTQGCLMQFILHYFGETVAPCGRCGNCTDDREAQDITVNAQKVLSTVVRLHQRFGKGVVAQVLTGANNQKIRSLHLESLSTYGLLSDQRQKSVTELVDFLTASGYLQAQGGQYPVLQLTKTGAAVLKGEERVTRKTAVQATKQVGEFDDGLFQVLRQLRSQLAEEQQVPPFVIFSDQSLQEMCQQLPTTDTAFLAIKGVGQSKLTKYGESFMAAIRDSIAGSKLAAESEK